MTPPGRLAGCAIHRFGVRDGIPTLYHHGWPGAAIDAALLHHAACRHGLQMLAVDRPGTGGTPSIRARGLLPVARMLVHLIDGLGWDRLVQVGVSGGAPFALATAALLGERCRGTVLLGGMGPPVRECWAGMPVQLRLPMYLGRHLPAVAPLILRCLVAPLSRARPATIFDLLAATCAAADRRLRQQAGARRILGQAYRQAFAQGGRGPVRDVLCYLRDWDLDLARVRSPVWVWHGAEDRTVAPAFAGYYATQLAVSQLGILPGEGHFSLPAERGWELLAPLLGVWREEGQ